jgi:ComF family protein
VEGSRLLDLLLPPACAGCRRRVAAGRVLCPGCDHRLPRLSATACTLCQAGPGGEGGRCRACRGARGPLLACLAAAPYTGEAALLLSRFKYPAPGLRGLDPGPRAVAEALVREAARLAPWTPDLVVPVPLHPRRLRARGFHPSGLLARAAAREVRVRFAPALLRRVRDTPSQTGLDRRARARNVASAFCATRPAPARVWLVDDVVTTGATLHEAACALRDAGARAVCGLCAARTPATRG